MKTFFLHRSRDSQITQEREKIILYPSFCVHARLCPIITLPRFISSQRLLVVVFTPTVQLPPDPLSFDFLARDCRQGQIQMHPHDQQNSDVPFYFHRVLFISKHYFFTFTQFNLYYRVTRVRQPIRHIRLDQQFFWVPRPTRNCNLDFYFRRIQFILTLHIYLKFEK